jgi:hypothetical protein
MIAPSVKGYPLDHTNTALALNFVLVAVGAFVGTLIRFTPSRASA